MAIGCNIRFPARWLAIVSLVGTVGCNHQMNANPYAQPAAGNPWTTTNAATMPPGMMSPAAALPPPPGQQATVPATPSLPPPQGFGAPAMPPPGGRVQGPNWNNPGTLSQQQQRANVFDPFANNEMGPAIEGGRPRDFQKPMTEATRAHDFPNTRIPF